MKGMNSALLELASKRAQAQGPLDVPDVNKNVDDAAAAAAEVFAGAEFPDNGIRVSRARLAAQYAIAQQHYERTAGL